MSKLAADGSVVGETPAVTDRRRAFEDMHGRLLATSPDDVQRFLERINKQIAQERRYTRTDDGEAE
jgi:hypothetical protein